MSNLSEYCSVCISNISVLRKITLTDANQIKWSSKLEKCVPEVDWSDDCYICLNCIENLEIAYTFCNLCLQSYEVRKQQKCVIKIEPDDFPDVLCIKDEIQSAINKFNQVSHNIDLVETPQNDVKEIMDIKTEEFCLDENKLDSCINIISSDEEFSYSSSETTETVNNNTSLVLLPVKSKYLYQKAKAYSEFQEWAKKNKINPKSITENILLTYFLELSKVQKSSSLWIRFSMLKLTLIVNDNIDIKNFNKLTSFLKRKSHGYKPKIAKGFTRQDIIRFLNEAPDEIYLMKKVVLIIGVAGSCRLEELLFLERDNIQDMGYELLITVIDSITKIERSFTVINNQRHNFPDMLGFRVIKSQEPYFPDILAICRKYMDLRPAHTLHKRLFLNYQKGKCINQLVGINTFAKIPREIAEYLKLPESSTYTGHSLRRTSATFLAP